MSAPMPVADGEPAIVAYVVGTFPTLTETFVLREMAALRRRGVRLVVCAARRATRAQRVKCPEGLADVERLYAHPDCLGRHLAANLLTFVRHPGRYLAGLRLFLSAAWSLPPRDGLRLMYHFVAGVGFAHELHGRGVRHLHSHFTSATNMALAAAMMGDVTFSFSAHASDDLFVRPLLMIEKVERARFVVAVSEYSRRYLDSITGFRYSAKLHRIYNGIVPAPSAHQASDPLATETTLPGEPVPRILSVGSLVSAKGHTTLVQACAALRQAGLPFACRIVGEGPERSTLERLIRELDVGDHVELVGALQPEDVEGEFRRADVFALLTEIGPSGYRDGFPTVILEAMAFGVPVVASSMSGIPEMVQAGVTGLLVPERAPEEAAKALRCLLESPPLRRTMGSAGQQRVRDRFPLDRAADELAALLKDAARA